MSHRGAVGADPATGDGAGILMQMPHEFFRKATAASKFELPPEGEYGSGLVFLPPDIDERIYCKEIFYKIIVAQDQHLLGWRKVPINDSVIGKTAKETLPVIAQIFIGKNKNIKDSLEFERKLYIIRKKIENLIRQSHLRQKSFFYITNISSCVFSYKGLLKPEQLKKFFSDLCDPTIESALALVHSRYSTNTFPTWDLAQPFRYLAHNGEINTLRGNINWMRAREGQLSSDIFREDIEKIKPILVEEGSDSAIIDNAFELLVLSGYSLAHAMTMLIPPAWEKDDFMDETLRDFYKYHACSMEPWDGPAAIAFTDGKRIGAVLDRNGLRPARYIITKENLVVMASEVGVLDIAPGDISYSGRLEPGKIFYIDTERRCIIHDKELKKEISNQHPYSTWIKGSMLELKRLPEYSSLKGAPLDVLTYLKAFGYTREDLKVIIKPMAQDGHEPIGSMGNDTPHAVLSKKPQLLYNYFRQLFAQVTNPAIDPIRENIVMSLESYIGPQQNILTQSPHHCRKLLIEHPVLTNQELNKIKYIKERGFKTKIISLLFEPNKEAFYQVLEQICHEAVSAIKEGFTFIVLSDRGIDKNHCSLPALLAISTIHHHLIKESLRTQIGIIIESAEPREVHHFALLFAYGADCINPYLAYEAINYMHKEKEFDLDPKVAQKNYVNAIEEGILKIISKMGISTLNSYRGAQIFEALGLNDEIINRCFSGTISRIGGAGFEEIAQEAILRHQDAFPQPKGIESPYLASGGIYQWKRDGEFHLWNPESISALQDASRLNDYAKYKEFAQLINNQSKNPTTLRGLVTFRNTTSIDIEKVEPIESIFKRFATGAMSYGSISRGAHETLAIAMNRIGGRSNTGEGGEDPIRFKSLPNGDSMRSAIKQIASGRFGVTTNYLVNADELQIKIAQGAKPGEGGQLPGHKVSAIIARTRYTTPGVTLISPPPHHDIYSIEDLAQLIFDLKNVNPDARISVKLVSEIGVGTVAAGVAKGHADMILVSGGDGGTGASPKSSIRHAGLPWELGLSEIHQTLVLNNLRSRIRLQTDGQMRTGRDVAIAAILGAEEYGFCTAALIVMGCVMLRHCHLNNCSLGVATQDPILEKRFRGRTEHLISYFTFAAKELREIMAQLGVTCLDDMIGRTDLLDIDRKNLPWKAQGLDYSRIFYQPGFEKRENIYCTKPQNHVIDTVLDQKIIEYAKFALESQASVKKELEIKNFNRTTGAMLSGEICKRYGESGLANDTIHFKFNGIAGQSFGAFLAKGVTFELEGLANDYVGKGISGGKIIIYPDKRTDYLPEENIIIGNTGFYGAIAGEAYINGMAGERFCIRNSGLYAVVEGLGDHGCEYMTGGRVVVLGKTGRNFAAGMSGGIAYVYDPNGSLKDKCNLDMAELEALNNEDKTLMYNLLHNHVKYTASRRAKEVLDNFKKECKNFIKVVPLEYKVILKGKRMEEKLDLMGVSDG